MAKGAEMPIPYSTAMLVPVACVEKLEEILGRAQCVRYVGCWWNKCFRETVVRETRRRGHSVLVVLVVAANRVEMSHDV